jgi:glucosyl-3-phosphoglycerate synthase
MSDFHQNGIIATLHNFNEKKIDDIEKDLLKFSQNTPMTLILPSLYSELQRPALTYIVNTLKKIKYIKNVIIGLDQASKTDFQKAKRFFYDLPQNVYILWNDGPRLKKIDLQLKKLNLSPQEKGKGRNIWYCMGFAISLKESGSVAMHDCDIVTYNKNLPAKLFYPVANPNFHFDFCKGYYPRVAQQKMNGRVTRLLVTPLLKSLQKILGHNEYLTFLDCFKYPLAGEFSFKYDLLNDIRIPHDWGLEIGILSEMYRNFASNRICQVDIADTYEHKHQEVSKNNKQKGLSKMTIDISKALFRKLATQGHVFSNETFRSLKATYYRMALDMVQIYKSDAEMNGLEFDVHKEEGNG